MPWWVKIAAGVFGGTVSAYFWLRHEWQALVGLGIGVLLGMAGSGIKWFAELRKSWHEGSLAKHRHKQLLHEQQDEAELPDVVRQIGEIETTVRAEQNLHGWIDMDDLENIFVERLPQIDRRLIRKGILRLKQKKKELSELWAR
jgi:hypothetical protein